MQSLKLHIGNLSTSKQEILLCPKENTTIPMNFE